jgi:ubiquinone/menaquinone biosynthesis C-methylase UbiE
MGQEVRKDFDKEAVQWDANPGRVRIASDVAAVILQEMKITPGMNALDFGCGTGLLTLKLQPHVATITGVDNSQGMLDMLRGKIAAQRLDNVKVQYVDFEKGDHAGGHYDLVVSSMVAHHVPDTLALFKEWFQLLQPGGQLGFADLDTEDGSFHGDNTGVFHLGFDRQRLKELLQQAGFEQIRDTTATVMEKEVAGQGMRKFPIFLMTAKKS